MILNSRATWSFVLTWIETLIEKSKYGLLDLRVHKENDNLVKKIETQFCDMKQNDTQAKSFHY